MESPVFRLEGIIKVKDGISDFEGPLTLILLLLSKNKIEIRDISISLILEQYLGYLDKMAELDLDIASEFVAMASHLTYIKTKMLLHEEEVSELSQLISSLEELQRGEVYQQIKVAAQTLAGMYTRDGIMMTGPPEFIQTDEEIKYEQSSQDLLEAMAHVIGRENALIGSINPREVQYPRRAVFSIPDKISSILERLKTLRGFPLADLFYESESRTELIATLIAVLELCKVGSVILTGDAGNTIITYTGVGRDPVAPDFSAEE